MTSHILPSLASTQARADDQPGSGLKASALRALGPENGVTAAADGLQWSTASVASHSTTATSWAAGRLGSLASWVGLGAAGSTAARSDAHSTGTPAAGASGVTLPSGGFSAWLKSPSKVVHEEEGGEESGGSAQKVATSGRRTSRTAGDSTSGPMRLAPPVFTVSATAAAVLAERARERPTPKRKGLFRLLPFVGRQKGSQGGGAFGEGAGDRPHAKPGTYLARWFDWVDETPLASASIAQVCLHAGLHVGLRVCLQPMHLWLPLTMPL